MKDFIVTKRAANGDRIEVQYSAAGREELFANLKAEGVNAISVREGKFTSKPPRSAVRGLLAGLIVIVGAVAAIYFLQMQEPQSIKPAKSHHPQAIADKGDEAVKSTPAKEEAPKPTGPKPIRWAKGFKNAAIDDNGRIYFVPRPGHKVITNGLNRARAKSAIFKYRYQNELAEYMTAMPGVQVVGDMTYSDDFIKEVVETMSLPIEDNENDTPEQRQLRADMRSVMKKLQAEVDAGNDVAELFKETRKELQDLGTYKLTLEQEFRKIYSDKDMTDDDVDISLKAVNKMLEDKGIAPLEFNKVTREIIRVGHDDEAAKE